MQNLLRPTLVAMATTFALGAESNRLPACKSVYLFVTDNLQINSFLFLDGIEPFAICHLSVLRFCKTLFFDF